MFLQDVESVPTSHIRIIDPPTLPPLAIRNDPAAWIPMALIVVLGYTAIAIQLRMLRRLTSLTRIAQTTAEAAIEFGQRAETSAIEFARAQRPWLLVTAVSVSAGETVFRVIATNRGFVAAKVTGTADRVGVLAKDSNLPENPDLLSRQGKPQDSFVLVPGESAILQIFAKDDLSWICRDAHQRLDVERGDGFVVMFGTVQYRSLDPNSPSYETRWCYRWLAKAGESGLVPFGTKDYTSRS